MEESWPLVRQAAHCLMRRLPPSVEHDDLAQAGMAAVIEAAPRFRAESAASFKTFIWPRVTGAMIDSLRQGDWVPRSVSRASRDIAAAIRAIEVAEQRPARECEIAERMSLSAAAYRKLLFDISVQHVFSTDEHEEQIHGVTEGLTQSPPTPEEALETDGFLSSLHKAIAKLPERERAIVERSFFDGVTQREIATEQGLSESRICQLRTQAVARLKAQLGDYEDKQS
ncbi:MAG: sigma-70 family RNA polymerase sigma factor [bacterium]